MTLTTEDSTRHVLRNNLTGMLNVLITDDHRVVRQGLRQILEDADEISVIHEAENATELINKLQQCDYQVILLDISLPGKSGIELLKDIKKINPEIFVIMVSIYPEELYALSAMRNGASGYITKANAAEELIPAIRSIINGGTHFSSSINN